MERALDYFNSVIFEAELLEGVVTYSEDDSIPDLKIRFGRGETQLRVREVTSKYNTDDFNEKASIRKYRVVERIDPCLTGRLRLSYKVGYNYVYVDLNDPTKVQQIVRKMQERLA